QAAARLDELLATGKLRRGFNYAPEAGSYWAWFAGPKVRSFFDYRFALFPAKAEAFARARKALREDAAVFASRKPPPKATAPLAELHTVFRANEIDHVVLTGLDVDDDASAVAVRLLAGSAEWTPLFADGHTAIFGWRDPQRTDDPFAGSRLDFNKLAF